MYDEDVRTIRVKNLEEARDKLYRDYGKNYSIKDKRTVPHSGFLGLFQKDMLEVSYTVGSRSLNSTSDIKRHDERASQSASPKEPSVDENSQKQVFVQNRDALLVSTQFGALSKQIEHLSQQINANMQGSSDLHPTIRRIQELLFQNEFTYSYIQEMTEKIRATFPLEQLENFSLVERSVIDWIGETITIVPQKVFRKPHVVIVIGPTGVGKTTTLVKMATQFYIDEVEKAKERNIQNYIPRFCFITTDTMRVGALEQLKNYGEILSKDVLKAQTQEDVQMIFEEYKDVEDAIFIDTCGYGPNDATHIADLKTTLSVQGLNADIYLAVAASTKPSDLNNIMQNYEPFGYQSVIITKCDESLRYGNIISVLHEKNKKISLVTNGQKIRRTILSPTVIGFLKRLDGFSIDRIHLEDKFGGEEEYIV